MPPQAREVIDASLRYFPDHPLEVEFRGRYCHVGHAGEPLCRLAYTGGPAKWDLAVYRYSSASYRPLELAPARDIAEKCIRTALGAYNPL